ncbi:LCP family protein [Ligilactobacillus ceti]|uniref:LytR family transcriptional regulator n=1 Tax=Ligilactobacillus ceti DSM 22408 TaxID=1122146 RepID=A0A0R2KGE8_9LACO|nr:LCP family protein [Ligilactobacillus ceti]KRN88430.1 LytR family transcriptional regulator [Ligilactobacillus ceti DSM 22408]
MDKNMDKNTDNQDLNQNSVETEQSNDSQIYSTTNLTRKKSHKKRKITCAILLIISLIGFFTVSFWGLTVLSNTKQTINKTYEKTKVKKLRNVSDVLKEGKPFSILLLGTDTGAKNRSYKGRTDTMIIATINPKSEKVTLTSIPRDSQVKIIGSNVPFAKINAAYTYDGIDGSIRTVQHMLHVPIDFYILVDMEGLIKLVDALGGVTVTPPLTFTYESCHVVKGQKITLKGTPALDYARMRYDDPEGDYGRQKRQKQIISAIIKKSLSTTTITQYKKILKTIEHNVKTDLTYDDMMTIVSDYTDAGKSIKSYTVQGVGAMINGSSYQVVSPAEKKKNSDRIRKALDLKPSNKSFYTSFAGGNYGNYAPAPSPTVPAKPAARPEPNEEVVVEKPKTKPVTPQPVKPQPQPVKPEPVKPVVPKPDPVKPQPSKPAQDSQAVVVNPT